MFLCLLGLAVRLGFFVEHARNPSFGVPALDEKYYHMVAQMLLAGEDLRELHGFRPLLYPMFLAFWYKLGGAWGVDLALLVQHLLGVATGLIVALLGARLFRHRLSGLIGGALFLLAPVPLYFEGELLIEPSYTFLICLGLLLILHAVEAQGRKSSLLWLLAGGLTALTAQARANILVFLAVYPLFAAWCWWRTRDRAALRPLLGLVGAFAMMIPWGFINMKQSDHFHLMPNAGGVAFYAGNCRSANGMFAPEVIAALSRLNATNGGGTLPMSDRIASGERYQDLVEVWARAEYQVAMRAQGREPDSDPMAISRYWTGRTMEEIRAAPAAWLRLMAKKCWLTLWNVEVPNNKDFAFLQTEFVWLRMLPVRWVILLMLAPAGIWAAARWGNRNALFIVLAYAGLYSAGNILFFICDRYRYPVWPAMAVIAGGGLWAGVEMIRQRRFRAVAGLLAGMALMAALSLPNWFHATLPNFAHDFQFRSIAWYDKGHFPEALEDIQRSLELDPLDPASHYHLGNVLFALNRFEDARLAYEATLKLIPGDSRVWNNLGVTLDSLGRTSEALQAFRHSAESSMPSQTAFLGIAFIQVRSGQLDEATATLDQLAKLQPEPSAAAVAVRSVIERRRGHVPEADALEQKARTRDADATTWAIEQATKPAVK